MRILFSLSFIFIFLSSYAQETYGLLMPGANFSSKCGSCITTLKSMPSEVSMSVRVDEFNRLYFIMTDIDWFNQLFRKNSDGITVDVLLRDDFNCDRKNTLYTTKVSRGTLLPPVYLKEMKEKMQVADNGMVLVDLGLLPQEFRGNEYELNLLLLNKKYVCHYTYFYNIKRYKWDLLNMGLYTDTVISNEKEPEDSTRITEKVTTAIQYKKLNFTIPFEKNKSNYTKEDIVPLYDSLSLNLYDIKRINIRAYSSVEGSKANNIKLQELRAKSIVEAMQTFQTEEIIYNISSAENWLEFYDDIKGTEFESLSSKSKEEIKQKLSKDYAAKMEPILGQHRKAVIEIEIEKKTTFKNFTEEQIVTAFKQSITDKDEETAKELMNLAFQRVINKESPNNFLNQLEIPNQQEFGLLNNRKTVFQYFLDEEDLMATYTDMLELQKLLPKSKEVNYNLASLKFKLWLAGSEEIKPEAFEKEIKMLTRYGVSPKLVNRMLINYNIIMSEVNMFKRDYNAKDKNLKSIFMKYKTIKPTSQDLLRLAQYFVAYGKYDWATKLLKPYIGKVDTDEDLLFYYINLTVANEKTVKERSYKKIILNAVDLNEQRFCKIFDSALQGGVSFQLLDIPVLKENFCESCN